MVLKDSESNWKNEWLNPFLRHLESERHLSQYTTRNYGRAVEVFAQGIATGDDRVDFGAVSLRVARDFLIEQQSRVSRRTLHNYVSGLRAFYRYWIKQGKVAKNPLHGITLPKLSKRLPSFMTEKQITDLLDAPMRLLENETLDPFQAWRDRLVLELLYGGGLRISELVGLTYGQVSFEEGVARVVGKGGKSRVCPLGRVAMAVLERWRREYAPRTGFSDRIIVGNKGQEWGPRPVQLLMKKYLSLSDLPMDLTPHKIRHSYATHLLDNGADLRLVQELLGHSRLSTTQIYTHVNVGRLKAVFDQAHPRA